MARRFRTNRVTAQRRETLWLFGSTVESTMSGAPTAILINSLNASALSLRPFTIIRTRGIMQVVSDQNVGSESYMADLGMSVVSDQAVAIGVSAVPTPLTDKGSDLFFVYEQLPGRFEISSGVGFESSAGRYQSFDSKAMRRVNDDQDVVVTVENEVAGCQLLTSFRMLIKLH